MALDARTPTGHTIGHTQWSPRLVTQPLQVGHLSLPLLHITPTVFITSSGSWLLLIPHHQCQCCCCYPTFDDVTEVCAPCS